MAKSVRILFILSLFGLLVPGEGQVYAQDPSIPQASVDAPDTTCASGVAQTVLPPSVEIRSSAHVQYNLIQTKIHPLDIARTNFKRFGPSYHPRGHSALFEVDAAFEDEPSGNWFSQLWTEWKRVLYGSEFQYAFTETNTLGQVHKIIALPLVFARHLLLNLFPARLATKFPDFGLSFVSGTQYVLENLSSPSAMTEVKDWANRNAVWKVDSVWWPVDKFTKQEKKLFEQFKTWAVKGSEQEIPVFTGYLGTKVPKVKVHTNIFGGFFQLPKRSFQALHGAIWDRTKQIGSKDITDAEQGWKTQTDRLTGSVQYYARMMFARTKQGGFYALMVPLMGANYVKDFCVGVGVAAKCIGSAAGLVTTMVIILPVSFGVTTAVNYAFPALRIFGTRALQAVGHLAQGAVYLGTRVPQVAIGGAAAVTTGGVAGLAEGGKHVVNSVSWIAQSLLLGVRRWFYGTINKYLAEVKISNLQAYVETVIDELKQAGEKIGDPIIIYEKRAKILVEGKKAFVFFEKRGKIYVEVAYLDQHEQEVIAAGAASGLTKKQARVRDAEWNLSILTKAADRVNANTAVSSAGAAPGN